MIAPYISIAYPVDNFVVCYDAMHDNQDNHDLWCYLPAGFAAGREGIAQGLGI